MANAVSFLGALVLAAALPILVLVGIVHDIYVNDRSRPLVRRYSRIPDKTTSPKQL